MTTEPRSPELEPIPENVADVDNIIQLPFENLRCFEAVKEQFAHLGVFFENTVVLQPSNVAYFPAVGRMVLMGAPRNGWIEITFTVPVAYFACRLSSSHPTTVTAYDGENQVLQLIEIEASNSSDPYNLMNTPPANFPVIINNKGIQQVTFSSLDGQLVIHDVRFGV